MDFQKRRRRDYDVEIDESDRLKQIDNTSKEKPVFSSKISRMKIEFHNEEDPCEQNENKNPK